MEPRCVRMKRPVPDNVTAPRNRSEGEPCGHAAGGDEADLAEAELEEVERPYADRNVPVQVELSSRVRCIGGPGRAQSSGINTQRTM